MRRHPQDLTAMRRGGGLCSARLTSTGSRASPAPQRFRHAALVAALAAALAGCASDDTATRKPEPAPIIGAQLRPTGDSRTTGLVTFEPTQGGLKANVTLFNTGSSGRWRVAIHTTGICTSPNGFSAGPPLIPPGATAPLVIPVVTTEDGTADMTVRLPGITIDGPAGVMGRSVVVHFGNTGSLDAEPGVRNNRIACGVIGVIKPFSL
jgi:Cu/Zn superoxide dismutase